MYAIRSYYEQKRRRINMEITIKDMERENARLKKAVADLTLDKVILKEALEGNY